MFFVAFMDKYTPDASENLSFSILKQHYPHIFNFYQKAFKVRIRGFEHDLRKKHRTNLKIQFIDDLLLTLGEMVESEIFILIYNGLIDAENLSEYFNTLPTPNEIELIKNTEEDSPLREGEKNNLPT